tara:strand:+ start:4396 stop:5211 length:816 start_codon:yes stop_codon:yes gene_type:complete
MIAVFDFGISNTDIAISNNEKIDFFNLKTQLPIEENNLLELLDKIKISLKEIDCIGVSGGKTKDFPNEIDEIKIIKVPEVEAIGRGAKRIFEKKDSFLVMSLGTGTGCIFADKDNNFQYIGGIPVGGGTLIGLSKLLLNETDIKNISKLANAGDRSLVDFLIEDVVSGIDILKPNLSASNFAKVSGGMHRKEDISKALTNMIGEIIGTVAFSNALIFQKEEICFTGRTFLEPNVKSAIDERLEIAGINGIYSDSPGFENCLGILDFVKENY